MTSAWFRIAIAAAALAGCAAPGAAEMGQISGDERDRLRALGVEHVEAAGDGFALRDADRALVGRVVLDGADGYVADLNGERASLRLDDSSAEWTCGDGYVGTATLRGDGLMGWIGSDPQMSDGPCVASLAVGWIVSGIFKTPPEGCVRIIEGAEARLECAASDEGRVASPLLAPGCGGGGGGGGWDDCTDETGWCSPACSSCFSAPSTSTSFSSACEPGGGGGGGGPVCGPNRTFSGSDGAWSRDYVDPSIYCPGARTNAERQCRNGWVCRARVTRTTTGAPHCNDYGEGGYYGDPWKRYYCFCDATAECEYSLL